MKIVTVLAGSAVAAFSLAASAASAAPSNQGPPSGSIYSLTGQPLSASYVEYSTSFVASSTSTFLTFAIRSDPSYILLDDVSLTSGGGPNLLVNGGFESGVVGDSAPVGWTYLNVYGASYGGVVDSTDPSRDGSVSVEGSFPHSGANEYSDGAVQAYDAITQDVATTTGATYNVSFWVADTNGGAGNYQPLSTNGDVTDSLGNANDLFVYEGSAVPTVPEPATWALMLVGVGGLGAAMRSRRKLAAVDA
jgi:hypothetical protein